MRGLADDGGLRVSTLLGAKIVGVVFVVIAGGFFDVPTPCLGHV